MDSRGVVAAALLAMLVAGCTDGGGKDATVVELGDGSTIELAEGGAISGVVVDEAIRPLAAVNVTVIGTDLVAVTDEGGLFAVPDLDPGLYTLSAKADGYVPIQTTAEVVLGETAKVRIVLPLDSSPKPYHTTYKFDWYDEAGVTLVDFVIDLTDRSFLNDSLPPACDVCYFPFQSDGPVHTFVIEAAWVDTISDPAKVTEFFWTLDGLDSGEYIADYFTSPGRAEVPAGALGNDTNFAISMTGEEEWITYQQHAQLFITLFYLAAPPEGWSVVAGDS